ncbi:putative beta-neurotoxin RjAa1 [Centruroides sculpturatus]|uniref:putative beta-neurotoxin RjAa1 n=1 Tax=Centruroides sculpturatus TaxID=218467 RepID=UPI000C6D1CFF|nr:putative beta-neurotoxin RjAa1 [Centruroides sculpturatus]
MRNLILMVFSVAVAIREMECLLEYAYPIAKNGCRISCVPLEEDDLCIAYCQEQGADDAVCSAAASACLCYDAPDTMMIWNAASSKCPYWNENSVRFLV